MVVGSKRFYEPGRGELTFPSWTKFGENYCIGKATVVKGGLQFDASSTVLSKK